MIINYGHRGASGYFPENTMIAFEKALEMGATGIETDVQMTKDGVLVLIHDEYVNRTTDGIGLVKDFTYKELMKLNASSYMKTYASPTSIPTVEELIALAKEKNITVNFEIKSGIIIYPNIEEKLIEFIYKKGLQDNVILSSFNHYSLVKCKEVSKEINTGILYMEALYKPENYCVSIGANALHPHFYSAQPEIIEAAHYKGLKVNPFTVDDENIMKNLILSGTDGIITNYPDKLKNVMEDLYGKA
ncbi:glycerophosphodiester phosphodiesterase [Clostridium tunisiense]|uniref:glycerophosphodiester phosphodiesterase n=1 Tax=Clostridium tunisiense TaxID=219748 RepID=UPI0002F8B16E|nr:glycerophosphodiester phosphodiesterase [Clostridium tunisiense]